MAPSVDVNSKKNSNLSLHWKENLHITDSELKSKDAYKSEKTKKEDSGFLNSKIEGVKTNETKKLFMPRKDEATAIRNKFPTKVPIIVDRFQKESSLPRLDRSKFLVPQEITLSQFTTLIRNRLKLGSTQAFYLLVNNKSILSLSKSLAEVYKEHKGEDGFLYMTYASQEVFG